MKPPIFGEQASTVVDLEGVLSQKKRIIGMSWLAEANV